ncbi:B12-binding domain-containing radical SAM protein [Candidatus Contubernalis alkaliaceticus]|uniref:B12-binding domain-containing radical SAM protein n=1 Tax=Candidatus Contubernalis alkaliaceticus TaxID=338645 RepID=UPI001F4C2F1E|nr:radical SAM protein [Candidatus Contubernalis alkalaceticus]UNC90991.1 B12-binding domain-containing radical SAM protein [Candidatus Contubernalis alkalaceticus]
MKILLLEHPRAICPERCNDIANTPLSSSLLSGYAAGMLQSRGHQVKILEGYLDRLSYENIEDSIKEFEPDILGVHMVYHWKTDYALFELLEKIKRFLPRLYITVFGFYPTLNYEEIISRCPAVDSVILGEAELTFAEVAELLSFGKKPFGVQGLAEKNTAGKIIFSRREPVQDLDSLPAPVRTEAMMKISEVNIQGSRGCYGSCTFCYINNFYGKSRWRGRSPENISKEIDEVVSSTGADKFYFTDPNFFGPGEKGQFRARQMAELLKSKHIQFGIEARVNDIHGDTIKALVDAGLRHILIGMESGRDKSLKRMNKMTSVAQNEKALQILRSFGIEPNIGFIMFEPDSTLEDIRENFEFLQRNRLLDNLAITANLLYHHQIILKGTRAYSQLKKEGRLQISSSSDYEGTAVLEDEKVSALAGLMRKVTNHLFARMSGIWSGKVPETQDIEEKTNEINQLLVNLFESSLFHLERDKFTGEKSQESIAEDIMKKINKILGS